MDNPWFRFGIIYRGPDHHTYTPSLQMEEGHWILAEVRQWGTVWHLHTTVRPNGTHDRRCLNITAHADGYSITCVDVRSTRHLLYLDELTHTHFAITTADLACLTYIEQAAVAEDVARAE